MPPRGKNDGSDIQFSSFAGLYAKESRALGDAQPPGTGGESDEGPIQAIDCEPWVKTTPKNRVGVALSGGGIRSATFNLGLLEVLKDADLLSQIDYLSTVSGGGYIGSFWTRCRRKKSETPKAPALDPAQPHPWEPDSIRHLREFSRFLIPRLDIFETELWTAVAKVLGGLLFSITWGLLVMAAIILLWAGLAEWMVYLPGTPPGSSEVTPSTYLFGSILGGFLWITEHSLHKRKKIEQGGGGVTYVVVALLVGLSATWGWPRVLGLFSGGTATTILRFFSQYHFTWLCFLPGAYLLGIFALLSAFILLVPTGSDSVARYGAFDRVRARFLCLGLLWVSLAGLWEFSAWLRSQDPYGSQVAKTTIVSSSTTTNTVLTSVGRQTSVVESSSKATSSTGSVGHQRTTSAVGGTAAGLAALFAALRKWILGNQGDRLNGSFGNRAKNILPNLVANGAVLLLGVTVAMLLMDLGEQCLAGHLPLYVVVIPFLAILAVMLLVDASSLSLHEFYRSRLTRCYLGAANPDARTAAENRQTFERRRDDMKFNEDAGKPIHLVCCAANTVGDDRLSTLYRGARSAVLSRFGVSIGNASAESEDLRLSSALTASAAAFNSNMGRKSILLGRASCFLMTMMNLRLGLWVKHPEARRAGQSFLDTSLLREMFGLTECTITGQQSTGRVDPPMVHLSDGAHFENLGLYELVRRHCRYVIVSDAAEDPDYSFGDLANAVRRIREDFGIEIEIDTNPLRPQKNGFALQHMVVGTIHYDGSTGTDKGVLLFFKPVLTGDEPTDVLEYKRANPAFPQQGTGDQFYSEAQWESYRRLGEHALHSNTDLSGAQPAKFRSNSVQQLFRRARLSAEKVPWTDTATYQAVTVSCNELENLLRSSAPEWLRQEFFTDLVAQPKSGQPTTDDVFIIIRILQTLEEVAYACDLYQHWSHPLASGWMNYLSRWTNMPTLRRLWPVLKSLFASGLCEFLEERFGLMNSHDLKKVCALVEYRTAVEPTLLAGTAGQQWLSERRKHQLVGRKVYGLELARDEVISPLQVGLACIEIQAGKAQWKWDDLYVANQIRGAGFTSLLLDSVLENLENAQHCTEAMVSFGESRLRDQGGRRQIVELVDFYRSRGFEWNGETTLRKLFQVASMPSNHSQASPPAFKPGQQQNSQL